MEAKSRIERDGAIMNLLCSVQVVDLVYNLSVTKCHLYIAA